MLWAEPLHVNKLSDGRATTSRRWTTASPVTMDLDDFLNSALSKGAVSEAYSATSVQLESAPT